MSFGGALSNLINAWRSDTSSVLGSIMNRRASAPNPASPSTPLNTSRNQAPAGAPNDGRIWYDPSKADPNWKPGLIDPNKPYQDAYGNWLAAPNGAKTGTPFSGVNPGDRGVTPVELAESWDTPLGKMSNPLYGINDPTSYLKAQGLYDASIGVPRAGVYDGYEGVRVPVLFGSDGPRFVDPADYQTTINGVTSFHLPDGASLEYLGAGTDWSKIGGDKFTKLMEAGYLPNNLQWMDQGVSDQGDPIFGDTFDPNEFLNSLFLGSGQGANFGLNLGQASGGSGGLDQSLLLALLGRSDGQDNSVPYPYTPGTGNIQPMISLPTTY